MDHGFVNYCLLGRHYCFDEGRVANHVFFFVLFDMKSFGLSDDAKLNNHICT